MSLVSRLLSCLRPGSGTAPRRARLRWAEDPTLLYAIGDVHGAFAKLRALEARIRDDAAEIGIEPIVVMLGDYVDRGPASREVVEHLMAGEGLRRASLAGNHEEVLADLAAARSDRRDWAHFGLRETMASYGIARDRQLADDARPAEVAAALCAAIPAVHLDWMRALPALIETPTRIYVHAGVRPGVAVAEQSDRDLLWIRKEFVRAEWPAPGRTVVHGHTPSREVQFAPGRVGLDTDAARGGPLSALRVRPGRPDAVLQVE